MHVARILPASIRRAFSLMKTRLLAVFADAPIVFFAVVFGVALTFRVAVGAVRDAAHPEPVAPTFATTEATGATGATSSIVTGPEPGLPRGTAAAASTAEVGAAAKVQPIGAPPSLAAPIATTTPARVPPKPRGHGRRPIRGGSGGSGGSSGGGER